MFLFRHDEFVCLCSIQCFRKCLLDMGLLIFGEDAIVRYFLKNHGSYQVPQVKDDGTCPAYLLPWGLQIYPCIDAWIYIKSLCMLQYFTVYDVYASISDRNFTKQSKKRTESSEEILRQKGGIPRRKESMVCGVQYASCSWSSLCRGWQTKETILNLGTWILMDFVWMNG